MQADGAISYYAIGGAVDVAAAIRAYVARRRLMSTEKDSVRMRLTAQLHRKDQNTEKVTRPQSDASCEWFKAKEIYGTHASKPDKYRGDERRLDSWQFVGINSR